MLPPAVAGIGLLAAFGVGGLLGAELHDAGIVLPFTEWAVVLAVTFVASPFYMRQAITAFEGVDPTLVDAARTLGAGPARTFWRVWLPLAAGGLVAGWVLAFARGVGEFGATIIFAGNVRGPDADADARRLRGARLELRRRARDRDTARRAQRRGPALLQGDRVVETLDARHRRRPSLVRARRRAERRSARRSRSSARRAPARRRCCARSPGCAVPTAGGSRSATARGSTPTPKVDLAARAALGRPRLPGVRAVPAHDRARRTSPSAAARRARRPSCSSASASPTSPASARAGSRAASASASRSRARWRATRGCCCSTSRCRRSTRTRARVVRGELQELLAAARAADAARHARLPRRRRARRPHRRHRRRAPAPGRHRRRSSSAHPADAFVARLTGGNLLPGPTRDGGSEVALDAGGDRALRRAGATGRVGVAVYPWEVGVALQAPGRRAQRAPGPDHGARAGGRSHARARRRRRRRAPREELERLGLAAGMTAWATFPPDAVRIVALE